MVKKRKRKGRDVMGALALGTVMPVKMGSYSTAA